MSIARAVTIGLAISGVAVAAIYAAGRRLAPEMPASELMPGVEIEVEPAPPPDPRAAMLGERRRFESAKASLRASPPTSESAIVALLGEPSATLDQYEYKTLSWFFETKEVGRDVISVNVEKNGKLSLLLY